ncbi:hypothetical protein Tco_0257645 [Tanacetum coccineum]
MVLRAVLMKSDLVSVNTARQGKGFNTARPKAIVNAVKGNNLNAVKASACWVWKPKTKVLNHGNPQIDLQDQGVIDSGFSRHMTWNMSYLTNYEEIDGGYVAFGGNPKEGKITRKCTIKTVAERRMLGLKDILLPLKLVLLVMEVTTAGFFCTAGEDCKKYSKSLLLLEEFLLLELS